VAGFLSNRPEVVAGFIRTCSSSSASNSLATSRHLSSSLLEGEFELWMSPRMLSKLVFLG